MAGGGGDGREVAAEGRGGECDGWRLERLERLEVGGLVLCETEADDEDEDEDEDNAAAAVAGSLLAAVWLLL